MAACDACCEEFEIPVDSQYAITEEEIHGFLIDVHDDHTRCYNALHNYIAGFAFYVRSNSLPDLTKSITFRNFRSTLRREMASDSPSHRKQPIHPKDFDMMLLKSPAVDLETINLDLLATLFFYISQDFRVPCPPLVRYSD
jgi:hypothetical protein